MIAGLKPYAEMKDPGIPWLGRLPAHWHVSRGKRLFRKMDRPIQEDDEVVTCFRDGVVTLRKNRRLRGFTESLKEIGYQGIREGDLVIHAMDAFAGAVGVSDSDGKGTPVYSVCSPSVEANPYYFAYLLREMARSQWIQALAKGIRERSTDFRFDAFANQLLPVPPKDEQAAIVRFLDHADRRIRRAIAAKQKLIRLLEEQKQAIIHRAVTRGLDPDVRLKPSGVEWQGDVPEHWDIYRVKQVSQILRGKFTYRPRNDPSLYDGPYPFIQTGEVARAQKIITEYRQTLNDRGLAVSKMFPKGTLVMTIAANIGEVAVLDFEACFPDSVVGFVPSSIVDRDYLYYIFLAMKQELLREAPVNTQGNLNVDRIGSRRLALPPLVEQRLMVSSIEKEALEMNTAIEGMRSEASLLREYRTRLIADVVTGKLDVREAAARLPDSLESGLDGDEALDIESDDASSDDEAITEDEAA